MSDWDPDGRDPSLAAERTDLAWNRSGLSLVAFGAVILRGIGRPPLSSPNIAVGVYVLVLGACAWFLGAWHAHRTRGRGARRASFVDLAPITAGVTAIGVAAFLLGAASG